MGFGFRTEGLRLRDSDFEGRAFGFGVGTSAFESLIHVTFAGVLLGLV